MGNPLGGRRIRDVPLVREVSNHHFFTIFTSFVEADEKHFRELQHINVPVMLMPDDFRAFSKIKIDNHAFNKENLPSHFKVRKCVNPQQN